ncbi:MULTISPECIES: superoxide dismutase [unclassified Mesobacillus]|uniref:superoxide dismutase n=1 Tax=unclassified Mesobacillus TaxID=2675270 RepID=UPI00203FD978|nr:MULTISPECIES: superoxide dismutase [unclassified Mesobacillus]MCM3121590.1 superoxide dismutase [Mesobacillus sp. MER 33]MCM3231554.1 superoxide dismutase [Mesobacillus sp. MER 48]
MNGYWFRYSLQEWWREMEEKWDSVRAQLRESGDQDSLEKWEENFFTLKKKAESNLDEEQVYAEARKLFDELTDYVNDPETGRQQAQRLQPVPIGGHKLPPMPYAYNALEPVIDREIMRLHHLKHHQTYVDGLNKAEKEMQKARQTGDFSLIKHWEREAAFHGSGHYLHTIFWNIMVPNGGGAPKGQLSKAINDTFGSFEGFKKHFTEAAKSVEAVGWAILVWSPRSHRLEILQAEKHQNLTQWDVVPLLVLDVWEHAYYLQYKNERAKYVENWWNVVNWKEVEQRFNKARTLAWQPF